MTNDNFLNVWHDAKLVGKLWQNATGRIGFKYEFNWLDNGFAISQQLPLISEVFTPDEGKAHQFFANLLPEGDARNHIVRDLKIANSDFALLKAIGGECAGALSLLPIDYEQKTTEQYKKITDQKLKQVILRKGQLSSFAATNDRPRLSLAGAQDKCAVYFDGKDYYLPQGNAASTHILKFEMNNYNNIPAYEYFLTRLAATIDLPVADVELKQNDSHYYLLIKRYDRILKNNMQVQRLHQEDFCQALGISYERKYQHDGGPAFSACYRLLQQVSSNPIQDLENLLKWQIFNVLAGNSDGHAKNLAFIYGEQQQARLAPFYDLVCTRAIERINADLAMSIGGEFNPAQLILKHWQTFAKECNVREPYLIKMIREVAERLLQSVITEYSAFEEKIGKYPALQRVQMVVNKQCKKALMWC